MGIKYTYFCIQLVLHFNLISMFDRLKKFIILLAHPFVKKQFFNSAMTVLFFGLA